MMPTLTPCRLVDRDGVYYLCGWSLPHRDKHMRDCVCVLPVNHEIAHRCAVEYP